MNVFEQEEHLLGKAKDLLNEGVENLDSRTGRRLEESRRRALNLAAEKRTGFLTPFRWIMVGSFATATMAAAALFFWLHTSSPGVLPARQIEDFEIITSREHIEVYQDLEFYRWLAAKKNGRAQGDAL